MPLTVLVMLCSAGKVGEPTKTGTELTRKGSLEGRAVDNILLDTGCLRSSCTRSGFQC